MKKIIVTASEYVNKIARLKIVAARNIKNGIDGASGTYFSDGATTVTAIRDAANALEMAADNFDANPSDANRDTLASKEIACDLVIDDAVGYVQKKVNSETDFEIKKTIAHTAKLTVRKKKEPQPKPEKVTQAGAVFSNISQTILLKIKKKSKYSKYFEIWISLTPEDPTSWMFKDSTCGKQLLVTGLVTGQKYYLRIIACNLAGKSDPSEEYFQQAA